MQYDILFMGSFQMLYFYDADQCAQPEDATVGKCHGFERDKDKLFVCITGCYLLIVTKDAAVIELVSHFFRGCIIIFH